MEPSNEWCCSELVQVCVFSEAEKRHKRALGGLLKCVEIVLRKECT